MTDEPVKQQASNQGNTTDPGNNLFPIFLKLEELSILVVGGGNVGLEKLTAIINNSPAATITLVAIEISDAIVQAAAFRSNITLVKRAYQPDDLDGADLAIIAVNDVAMSRSIRDDAKRKGKLVNVADKPELCDFYLSSVVKKGNLKIAISTNGKSPTIAKRLKETFNELLPDKLDEVLTNMQGIRNQLKGDFASKVDQLNDVTKLLSSTVAVQKKPGGNLWIRILLLILLAVGFMYLGHVLF